MAFLCPSRSGKNKEKKQKEQFLGRITGSDSIDTLVRVGLEKQHGLKPDSRMVAVHDFLPCGQNELKISKGQDAYILYKQNDWAYVITEEGKEGFVPKSFLVPYQTYKRRSMLSDHENDFTIWEIEEETEPEDLEEEENNNDIDFTVGDTKSENSSGSRGEHVIELNKNLDAKSVDSKSTNAYVPMAPIKRDIPKKASTVENILTSTKEVDYHYSEVIKDFKKVVSKSKDIKKTDKYVVLTNFTAQLDQDITVEQGEVITVLNTEDKGRVWIRKSNNKEGFIPTSFCCLLKEDTNMKEKEVPVGDDPPPLPPRDYLPLNRRKSSDSSGSSGLGTSLSERRRSSDLDSTEDLTKLRTIYKNNGLLAVPPPPYKTKSGSIQSQDKSEQLNLIPKKDGITRSLGNLYQIPDSKTKSSKSGLDSVVSEITESVLNIPDTLRDNSDKSVFSCQENLVPGLKDCMNRSVHKIQSLCAPGIRDHGNKCAPKKKTEDAQLISGTKSFKRSTMSLHDIPLSQLKDKLQVSVYNVQDITLPGSVNNHVDVPIPGVSKDNSKFQTGLAKDSSELHMGPTRDSSKYQNSAKPRSPDFVKMVVTCDYKSSTEPRLSVKEGEIVFIDYSNQQSLGKLWVYSPRCNMCGNVPAAILKPPHQLDEQFTKIALV